MIECRRGYGCPDAIAIIKGGPLAPYLTGKVSLYQLKEGVCVDIWLTGIPDDNEKDGITGFHAFHIHENGNCEVGDPSDPFLQAGGHWNPEHTDHPYHAGDLPPVLNNNGYARMSVITDRFTVCEAIGHSFILHEKADDFTSQPSGAAGKRLGCGIIAPYCRSPKYSV